MVEIGPVDVPSWTILGIVFGGVPFYLIYNGELPANYLLFGSNIPLQDGALLVAMIAVVFGIFYQIQNNT
ncbi:hypothetical protein [Halorubrum xinjiangense]|uniref:hypothetical protein n=1 Tax=Halorubrum xinjiangense TaxID=261291 RepID=UPI00122DA94F|nr:hypothetical protein [Halorubrum xinjiangense]